MRSVVPMWIVKILNMLISVCLSVCGIILLAMPDMTNKTISIVVGILLVAVGAFKLLGYFSKDLFRLAFEYDLQLGIVSILLGVVVLIESNSALNFICIIFGISIFIDGLFKMKIAFDSKKFGLKSWLVIMIAAVLTCVYGLVLISILKTNEIVLTVNLGIALMLEGILNLIVVLSTFKIINHQHIDKL